MEKTHQVVWDALLDYGYLEWQHTLKDLQKVMDVAYQDVLDKFDLIWCVKGRIVTRRNLVATWRIQPRMGTIC